MEKIDLSTNSRKIQDAYDKTVKGDGSTTFVVYSVKDSVLDVTATGDGSLDEFVENFDDGKIQFGLSRVTVPGSDVSKILLLGWCPDNAPSKSRLSFASNFADVSRVLSGYHVQITARDQDDLDVSEFLNRVGAAAGARYSIQTGQKSAPPKPAAVKPTTVKPTPASSSSSNSFVPKSTGKPVVPNSFVPKSTGKPVVPITPKPVLPKPTSAASNDEWGGEDEIEERDFSERPLENVPSAYKPTTVNIDELRKQKSDTVSSQPKPFKAAESKEEAPEATPLADRLKSYKSNEEPSDGRLTSLPKAKVNHSVASRYNPVQSSSSDGPSFGSKPAFGAAPAKKEVVGGMSRNFANQGGKTPAQLWAEKRGQYKSVAADTDEPVKSAPAENNELASKFNQLNIGHNKDEEDEEEANEEPEQAPTPAITKPSSFPPPPSRVAEPEPEEEEEEDEEEPAPAPAASLPARSLPPPPVRLVPAAAAVSTPKEEEEEEPAPVAGSPAKAETSGKPSAVAEYDYEKDEDNEIGFSEGDLIIEIEFVDEDWWSGKHSETGEVGLFPSSYVAIKEASADSAPAPATSSDPAPTPAPTATASKTATAEYDYEKDEDNEIAFAEGDVIVDIEFVDEDWWSGKHSKTGEVGLFPANYVKLD